MLGNGYGDRLLLTIWVGSLLAIGYIAVPAAFITLNDIEVAGSYAGLLFHIVNLIGVGCGLVLMVTKLIQYKKAVFGLWRCWFIVAMVLISLLFLLFLEPKMAAIKAVNWKSDADLVSQFSSLHTLSENLYLAMTLLGLALVVSTDSQSQTIEVK
jgi:hypothetical protein